MERMMAEHNFEHDSREARKSLQAAQSTATDEYKTGIDLFRRGIERNIEVQKHVLDIASEQNAEIIDLWRNTFGNFLGAEPMLRFTEQAIKNLIGARRKYLNIVEGSTHDMAESAKTQGEQAARTAQEMTESAVHQHERPTAQERPASLFSPRR
jgi:hypothetical protein